MKLIHLPRLAQLGVACIWPVSGSGTFFIKIWNYSINGKIKIFHTPMWKCFLDIFSIVSRFNFFFLNLMRMVYLYNGRNATTFYLLTVWLQDKQSLHSLNHGKVFNLLFNYLKDQLSHATVNTEGRSNSRLIDKIYGIKFNNW